jgi:hypothetical protein
MQLGNHVNLIKIRYLIIFFKNCFLFFRETCLGKHAKHTYHIYIYYIVESVTAFVQNLKVLECPWIWKQKFKALNVLEFVKKWLKVLKFFFSFWIFSEIVWHSKRTFCWIDFAHVHICQSCLKLIKVAFWTIQRQILMISNPLFSVFSPWICWYMALNILEFNSSSHVRTLEWDTEKYTVRYFPYLH